MFRNSTGPRNDSVIHFTTVLQILTQGGFCVYYSRQHTTSPKVSQIMASRMSVTVHGNAVSRKSRVMAILVTGFTASRRHQVAVGYVQVDEGYPELAKGRRERS